MTEVTVPGIGRLIWKEHQDSPARGIHAERYQCFEQPLEVLVWQKRTGAHGLTALRKDRPPTVWEMSALSTALLPPKRQYAILMSEVRNEARKRIEVVELAGGA